MIQFSARNSILRIYGWIYVANLAKSALINFGLIQLSAIPEMKPPGTSY